jgi:hypothetical protein
VTSPGFGIACSYRNTSAEENAVKSRSSGVKFCQTELATFRVVENKTFSAEGTKEHRGELVALTILYCFRFAEGAQ